MLITVEHAEKVRVKRGRLDLTKSATAKKLNVTPRTLKLIEAGNYDAPKRIYESVMNWLIEDWQKNDKKSLFKITIKEVFIWT